MKIKKSSEKFFGLVFGSFFLILSFYYLINYKKFNLILITISLFFFIFTYIYPRVFVLPNKIWIKFGDLLGKIISPVIMFFLYFTIIFITSIILRILGNDVPWYYLISWIIITTPIMYLIFFPAF